MSAEQRGRAEDRARQQLENSLRTRNFTVRSGMTPRTIILGTVRTSGPLMYTEFVGDNQEYLDSIVAVNAGELESVVGVYIGDEYIDASAITSNVPTAGKFAASVSDPVAFEHIATVSAAISITLPFQPVSGGLLYVVKTSGSGQDLVQETIGGTSVSGYVVSWSSGAVTGTVVVGYMSTDGLRPPLRVQFAMGSPTQASTTWGGVVGAGGTPKWTSNHRLQGVAYVRTLKLIDDPLFLAGDKGDVGVVARGPKGVWDPRTSTTLNYTSNPALLAAWFRMLPVADGGFGIPTGWIDWATVSAAANVCDELISVRNMAGTGYENVKRYECHTRLSLDQAPEDNLRVILDSMAGDFPFTGGFYKCFAGAFRSATVTLTDDDIAANEPITVAPLAGASVAPPNVVTANFYPATRNWVKQPAREVVNSTYVTADGAEEPLELDLVATMDERQANYLMGVRLERSRPSLAISLTATGKAANLCLLDTVQIIAQGYNAIAGKTFEVRRRTNQWNGRYPLELREIKSGTFTLDADRFTAAAVAAPPVNSILFDVSAVAGLTAVEEYVKVPGGLKVSCIRLNWTQHDQAYVRERGQIEVRWRFASGPWNMEPPVQGALTTALTSPIQAAVAVTVQVRGVNGAGAAGPWASAAPVVITDLAQYAAFDVSTAFAAGEITRSNVG